MLISSRSSPPLIETNANSFGLVYARNTIAAVWTPKLSEKMSIINPSIKAHTKTKIFSIGDPGNLTYDYTILGEGTQTIKDIVEEKHKFNDILDKSKKPIVIIGESALELKSGEYIFEELKSLLIKKKIIVRKIIVNFMKLKERIVLLVMLMLMALMYVITIVN